MTKKSVYKIGTFTLDNTDFPGLLIDDTVHKIDSLEGFKSLDSTLTLFCHWEQYKKSLTSAAAELSPAKGIPLNQLKVKAPIQARQIFCVGANYKKHVIDIAMKMEEAPEGMNSDEDKRAFVVNLMDERAKTGIPYAFVKLPSCINGPYDDLMLPHGAKEPDWELELAVVIGKEGKHINADAAMSHVAGYVMANDVTVRDRIYRTDLKGLGTDWLSSKCAETFLPLGPWILPADFVENYREFHIELKLNGQVMQNESVSDMIFSIERQIEYISSRVRLLPGDIICTGSPAGNGAHYGRFMQDGDVITGKISGLGEQKYTCVVESI